MLDTNLEIYAALKLLIVFLQVRTLSTRTFIVCIFLSAGLAYLPMCRGTEAPLSLVWGPMPTRQLLLD